MSSFPSTSTLQPHIFSSVLADAWSEDCLLCLERAPRRLLCAACDGALPRLVEACGRCALPSGRGAGNCACRRLRFSFDAASACFEYGFPVDRLVQRFKYAGDLAVGRWLALELAERLRREPRPDVIVVPPVSQARLRERGFNQALEIARVVAHRLGVRCDARSVVRLRETPAQAALSRRERRANLRGAFGCQARLEGLHVAIVDDVLTTGATADAIARAVKAAGAESVRAWAVARAPDPDAA